MIRQKLKKYKSWRGRLNWVILNSPIYEEEGLYLESMALEWDCCAVGVNKVILEKKGYTFKKTKYTKPEVEYPIHTKLYNLGCNFGQRIHEGRFKEALEILTEIENMPKLEPSNGPKA